MGKVENQQVHLKIHGHSTSSVSRGSITNSGWENLMESRRNNNNDDGDDDKRFSFTVQCFQRGPLKIYELKFKDTNKKYNDKWQGCPVVLLCNVPLFFLNLFVVTYLVVPFSLPW